jgi:integrase
VRKPPAYQLHKATGQARVKIAGRDYWLGSFGSEASHREYERLLAEWRAMAPARAAGESPAAPPARGESLTIAELMAAYWGHVRAYYVKDGQPTSEQENIRRALRPVRELYGHTPVRDFGPAALKTVREAMIARGWCRKSINRQIERVRGMFRWGAAEELLPPSVLDALKTVAGLRKGRSEAREKPPVRPVADEVVENTLPHLPPVVAAMVKLQRLTGARPHEVTGMRGADIDRSDPECWVYRPSRHKGQHHERERIVFIGPRAQAILTPYLAEAGAGYLFSPKRSEEARNEAKRAARSTPRWPSHCKRTRKAQRKRPPGEHYTKDSYRWAVRRGCIRAGVAPWHPHQLRHGAATRIRKEFGLDGSQAVLGHAEIGVTQIYADIDMKKDLEIMRQVG